MDEQDAPKKHCAGPCGQDLPLTNEYFYHNKKTKDGFTSRCKKCLNQQMKENAERGSTAFERTCSGPCGRTLPATAEYFQRNKNIIGGLQYWCKECRQAKRRKYPIDKTIPKGHKRCSGSCRKILPATSEYFYHNERGKYGLGSQCKNCWGKRRKENPPVAAPEGSLKRCMGPCGKEYPATTDFFYRNRTMGKYGLQSECKSCRITRYESYADLPKSQELSRIRQHKRRAAKSSVSGTHTFEQIQDQLKRQKHKCYYCQKKLQKVKGKYIYHIDHTFPISRVAGTDIPANSIDYLVLSCPYCNHSKNDKFPWEFPEGGRLL